MYCAAHDGEDLIAVFSKTGTAAAAGLARVIDKDHGACAGSGGSDDLEHGPGQPSDELRADLQRRESRLKRIREVKRGLQTRAKDEVAAAWQPPESAQPDVKAQYNFTDPESPTFITIA